MRVYKVIFTVACALMFAPLLKAQWTTGSSLIYYNGGSVGIGTSSPNTKLHVVGNIAASTTTSYSAFTQLWGDNAIIWRSGSTQGGLRFGSATDLAAANWSEKMRITDAGYVGIGTTSPLAPLHIISNNQATGDNAVLFEKQRGVNTAGNRYTFTNVGGLTSESLSPYWRGLQLGAPYITVNGANTFPALGIYAEYNSYINPTSKRWVIDAGNSNGLLHDIQFRTEGNNLLYLRSDGNVGIGTTNPQAKLAVNGSIYAQQVKVTQSGWSDYVFNTAYRLRPLSEVEQYIQQHHHLPEVPSAAEVEKNGLDVGDNQATLLKKIEELTLYVIEQNKKLEQLESKVNALQEENCLLKTGPGGK